MVNFSVLGRNATLGQRAQYVKFDTEKKERKKLRTKLSKKFPDLEVHIGGETGLDIFPKGHSKAQIREKINGKIIFFGDAIYPGGNDYALSKILSNDDVIHKVKNWEQTWKILKKKY